MRSSTRFLTTAAAAALALCPAAPGTANANVRLSSATACGAGKNDASKLNYTQFGVQNESTSASSKIWCPIVYDDDNGGDSSIDVRIVAVDQNAGSGKDVICSIWGVDSDGALGHSEPADQTHGSSSAPQSIYFISVGDVRWLKFSISCTLPAVSNGKKSSVMLFGPIEHD